MSKYFISTPVAKLTTTRMFAGPRHECHSFALVSQGNSCKQAREREREKEKMPPMNKKPQVIIGAGNEALMATAVADSINHKFPTARESKEQVLEV